MINWKLRRLIINRFRSQTEFAKKVKMSESVVSRVINGHRELSEKEAAKWQEVLR